MMRYQVSTKLARFSTDYSLVLEVKNDKGQLIDKAESVPLFLFNFFFIHVFFYYFHDKEWMIKQTTI